METPIKEVKKYNLTEGENDLKVYVHVVQAGPVLTTVPENYHATLAFTEQQAVDDIRKHYPMGQPHTIGKKSEIKIKQILDHLNEPPAVAMVEPAKETLVPPVLTEEQKFQNFINSTMLLADEYVKDTKKRNTLKKIVSELTFNGNRNEGAKTEDQGSQEAAG